MPSPSARPSEPGGAGSGRGAAGESAWVPPLVAIDGPSGSGKSTVARAVARRLGAAYLDTGAMYRALTWAVLQAGVPLDDVDAVVSVARHVDLEVGLDPDTPGVSVGGVPVDGPIRGAEVTAAVSAVSAVPTIRHLLVSRQRAVAQIAVEEALAGRPGGWSGAVVEGRDIGTVVLPDAPVKIFLTAQVSARAGRRAAEQADATPQNGAVGGATLDVATTAAALARRDRLDSTRQTSPLLAAADAVVLDSTDLSVEEVVEQVLQVCRLAGLAVPPPDQAPATPPVGTGRQP